MSQDSPVVSTLASFSRVAARLGLRWYLFGARAAAAWGVSRTTEDVDITVELGERPTRDLVDALEAEGFQLRFSDSDGFVEATRVLPLVHRSTEMPVDVVLAGPGLEEAFLDAAVLLELGSIVIPVICPEDLIVCKILAGRTKDLDDVDSVLRVRNGSLDMTRIRHELTLLQEALGQGDLLPALESAIASSRGRRKS